MAKAEHENRWATPPPGPIASPLDLRRACRTGAFRSATAGQAPGFVQGNLVILPRDLAEDFLRFAQRNPKPCPLIGVSEAGDPKVPGLGQDLDLRTDLPLYRVWRNGELVDEPTDISDYWRKDLVGFVIGCSFSFEEALLAAGVPIRHIAEGKTVPMFRTSMMCTPAGPFCGPVVMSMRPLTPANAIRAVQITSRFPSVHGAPVHIGLPEAIGIRDIARPNWGDSVDVKTDELPVFWACGVTPQAVIAVTKPSFAITHAPGAMLVTDRTNAELAII